MSLVALTEILLFLRAGSKKSHRIDPDLLHQGYLELARSGPERKQAYLSSSRIGIPSSGASSNQVEAHFAIGLFGLGKIATEGGFPIRLLDYQFPLQSRRADSGVGKIDLLGIHDNGRLVVIELKVERNSEDCRIALVQALIYSALIERNLQRIVDEFREKRQVEVLMERPAIQIVASELFWTRQSQSNEFLEFLEASAYLTRNLPIEIEISTIVGARLAAFGLEGRKPIVEGCPLLRPLV